MANIMQPRLKKFVKDSLSQLGVEINRAHRRTQVVDTLVVSLKPEKKEIGEVLLSYVIEPFLRKPGQHIGTAHTNIWESLQIAATFLELGYGVDVVSYRNESFIPEKDYACFVGARTNFDRLSRLLNRDCLKIVHQDTAHWVFNNQAAYKRLLDLQQRRGVTLDTISIRIVEHNWAIENAHCAVVLGNRFTIDTFRFANKDIHRVPISAPVVYPWQEDKDFERCRRNFIWFGSEGFVHKGLDLVLEAFTQMPDLHLTVCGPIDHDSAFKSEYQRELYETDNIHTYGWVDVASADFTRIAANCIGLVYPSCSEGGGGGAITCMHASLIPIVSYEASVDVGDFGIILEHSTIERIKHHVMAVAQLPVSECRDRARRAWEFARERHTRSTFAANYQAAARTILGIDRTEASRS